MRQLLLFGAREQAGFVDCLLMPSAKLHLRRLANRLFVETIRPMSPQEYCTGWRQVRVFITDPLPGAFHSFHYSNTIPHLLAGGLNTPFFASHYICGDEDSADTDIGQLPPNLRWSNGPNKTIHASIRFRFRDTGGIEQDLNNIIPGNCWKSGFLPFDPKDGLSGGRFSDYPTAQAVDHEKRAQMVGEIFHWNTRMYLDSFRPPKVAFGSRKIGT